MVAIIQTKLHPLPLRPNLVPRDRLLARLDAGLAQRRKLTLVTAPAGFGKTTLVSSWLEQLAPGPWETAWLSLDADDVVPVRFLHYVVIALRRLAPTFAPALFRADDSLSAEPAAVVRTIVNELAELNEPTLLVLDDLHAAVSPPLLPLLEMLVEYAPTRFHLVITSRDIPALPLARWQARNQITALTAADLRFDPPEAATFLTTTMGLQLDARAQETLEQRTEGWAAGLQLAALSLRSHVPLDIASLVSGTDRFIGDYLFSEVVDRQPPDVRRFMLATALLSRFNAPLCDALLGGEGSQILLTKLERANLFLIPLDNQRHWYRYHHLFGELLRELLQRTLPEAEISRLHRRAAAWFADAGLREEAIDHALQGGDPAVAAHLILGIPSQMLWEQGGAGAFIGWVERLPQDALLEFPLIAFLAAAAQMIVGDLPAALPYLTLLAEVREMAPYHQLLDAIVLRNQGHISRAMVQLRDARGRLPDGDVVLQTMSGLQLTSNYIESGLLAEAEALLAAMRARLAAGEAALLAPLLQVVGSQGSVALLRADLYRAADLYREGIALVAAEGGALHPMVGQMYSGLGDIYLLWDDVRQAKSYFQKAWSLGEESGISDLFSYSAFGLAEIAALRGDRAGVARYMDHMRRATQRAPAGDVQARLAAALAGYDLKLGDLQAALRWAAQCGLSLDKGPLHQHLSRWRTLLAVRLAEIHLQNAHDLLPQWRRSVNRVLDLARSSNQRLTMLRLLLQRAVAEDMIGERAAATASVQEALDIGAPGGVVRPFLDGGAPLQVLLEHMAQTQDRSRYLRRILHGFALELGRPRHVPGDPLPEPLTERETAVLKLMAAGLSNREIEEALVISRNTVRSHLKNLYGKLGTSGRVNAILRARELDILELAP